MSKADTNASRNLANQTSQQTQAAVQPSVASGNANQQQAVQNSQTGFSGAQSTLSTAADTAAGARDTINSTAPTYQSMMDTGGFTPTDKTTYLNRATQGVAGTYDVLSAAAKRQRAANGGLGTSGELSQMARQGTQAQAQATEGAQADLNQQINANKLAGAAGTVSAGQAQTGVANAENSQAGVQAQLYNTATGEITDQGKQVLAALGLSSATSEESANVLQQLSKNPGVLGNILSVAGVAGGVASGLGSLGVKV